MKYIKLLMKSLFAIFATVISLLTFGTIKLNKWIKSEYDIELLKLQLEKFNMIKRETIEKKLTIAQNKAVAENSKKKLKNSINELTKKLTNAKSKNDTIEFTKLVAQLEPIKVQLEGSENDIKSCEDTLDLIEKSLFQLDLMIEKYKGDINIAESYKTNATIKKNMNDVASNLYFDSQFEDSTSANKIKDYYDEVNVKEDARTEFLKTQIPVIETSTFNTPEDMENYLKKLK